MANNNSILTYLPNGWTEERYKNATDEDWETLSEEEAELLWQREIAEKETASKATRQTFKNTLIAKAEAAGAPPPQFSSEVETPQHHALVTLVEENNWQDFGFLVFRTYFGDDQLWEDFRESWDPLLQYGFDGATTSQGFDRVRDKLLMKVVDDEMMEHANAEGVAAAYRLFTEDEEDLEPEEELEPGLKTRMCLFVDEECMRSVTVPSADTPPFVKAVDVVLGATTQQRPGAVFRVAIKDLATQFYPALWLDDLADVADLRPLREDQVWTSLSLSVYGGIQQEQLDRTLGTEH